MRLRPNYISPLYVGPLSMLAVLGILIPSATFPAWKKFSRELPASSSVTIPTNQASLACWVSSAREVSPGNRSNYKSTRERVGSKGLCGRWRLHLMGSWCPGLLITLWGSWVSTTQLFFFKASHKPNDIGLSKYVSLSHSRTRRSHKMKVNHLPARTDIFKCSFFHVLLQYGTAFLRR